MPHYDVIVVGAGLSGLMAAKTLAEGGARVLVIEKSSAIGECTWPAATTRNMGEFDIPCELLTKSHSFYLHSPSTSVHLSYKGLQFLRIDRSGLAKWLAVCFIQSGGEIRAGNIVTSLGPDFVEVGAERITFDFLIGADGSNSWVRKQLNVPVHARNIVYYVEAPGEDSHAHFYLSPKDFGTGYAFMIPESGFVSIGCGVDVRERRDAQIKDGFANWLLLRHPDTAGLALHAGVMCHDYAGHRFGNIFLVGDAGGFSFGLTGEGVYPALTSGREVAVQILKQSNENSPQLEGMIILKKKQELKRSLMAKSDYINGLSANLLVSLMKVKPIQKLVFTSL